MSSVSTILIYGHDPTLLDTRRWVLEKAGFQVFTVGEMEGTAKLLADERIDLLLLCHTLTSEERRTIRAATTNLRPATKTLVMMTTSQEAGREETEGGSIHIFAGAAGLIAATRKLLN